jgi:hypothetical protein
MEQSHWLMIMSSNNHINSISFHGNLPPPSFDLPQLPTQKATVCLGQTHSRTDRTLAKQYYKANRTKPHHKASALNLGHRQSVKNLGLNLTRLTTCWSSPCKKSAIPLQCNNHNKQCCNITNQRCIITQIDN